MYILVNPGSNNLHGPEPTESKNKHTQIARQAEKDLKEIFSVNAKIEYVWSGTTHATEDGLPDFGMVPGRPSVFYGDGASLALGFWVGKQLGLAASGQSTEDYPLFRHHENGHFDPYRFLLKFPMPEKLKIFIGNKFIRLLD